VSSRDDHRRPADNDELLLMMTTRARESR